MTIELPVDFHGSGLRIGIVVARFNESITSKLLEGAKGGLAECGVSDEDVTIAWVPGSFEIPLAAKKMAASGRYDAVVCLGAVIRGETDHYEHIANQVASGVGQAGLETGVPVTFGVLTTHNVEQAKERSGGKQGNVGYDAALAAVEMATLLHKIASRESSSATRGAGRHAGRQ